MAGRGGAGRPNPARIGKRSDARDSLFQGGISPAIAGAIVPIALRLDDIVADGVTNQGRDRVKIQFGHDVGTVSLYSLHADIQQVRDFLVGISFRQELDNLPFSLGKAVLKGSVD